MAAATPSHPATRAARASGPLQVSAPPERFFGYYPGTVAVVTAAHGADRNVMSAGWHAALSADPPLYGVALGRQRYTHGLVLASGAFAVHFLPFEAARVIAAVGSVSRHAGIDKFERFDLVTAPGAVVPVPILQDAYLAYECRVDAVHATGDHDWVVGEVVALHHCPAAYDERSLLDCRRMPGAIYYGRSRYEALGSGDLVDFTPEALRRGGRHDRSSD
jgi:flavin reductase (DIM6/NTAB) family NADH-FMN oxidoreductase RutF